MRKDETSWASVGSKGAGVGDWNVSVGVLLEAGGGDDFLPVILSQIDILGDMRMAWITWKFEDRCRRTHSQLSKSQLYFS